MVQITSAERRGRLGFRAMLVGLGVDNFGSGLFLPLTLVYLEQVVGIPLSTAGVVLAVGTVAGTFAPAAVARLVDSWGPKRVVVTSQILQTTGMLAYLVARDVPLAVLTAVLTAAGVQVFYSALGAMTSAAAQDGDHDRAFATVNMVRTAAFGVGGLAGGLLLGIPGNVGVVACVALNAITFVAASATLAIAMPSARPVATVREIPPASVWAPLRNKPFLLLGTTAFLLFLSVDLFLVVMPPYADGILGVSGWAVGASIAVNTGLGAVAGTWAVARTKRFSRTTNLALAAGIQAGWGIAMALLVAFPSEYRPAALIGATVLLAGGSLIGGPRAFSLLAEIAPPEQKGAYFSLFQYSFTAAALTAPLFAGLLPLAPWAPWGLNALLVLLAFPVIGLLRKSIQ
ncbi:MFS transporter [Arthrobacter bambusae]|uniref:MFS transporter n=1 Tax=Arthrobacter bambusae TaxID=1338426 RepID=UPI001F512C22|nr:MFS transporter [Arthrobacter bambusae]MCI0143655.1 MFS transporter [Arthrobacter bambusae]